MTSTNRPTGDPQPNQEPTRPAPRRRPVTVATAVKALEQAGRPLTTYELIPAMTALGWRCRGQAYYSIFGALARSVKLGDSRLVKAGPGTWGLRDWSSS
jgi:hypothetical protein